LWTRTLDMWSPLVRVPAIGRVRANQAITEVGRPGRPQLIADRSPHAPQ